MQPSKTTLILTTAATALPTTLAVPAAAVAQRPPVASSAASKVVNGPVVKMRWGPVRVWVTIRGRRIVALGASAPTEKRKSARINGRAIPELRNEALRAQSARISTLSGATLTSKAFISSLGTALRQAGV